MKNNSHPPRNPLHILVRIFLCAAAAYSFSAGAMAWAAELSVEADVDTTPSEIRELLTRANALDAKIRELEKRIDTTQRSVLGTDSKAFVDYRLELKPSGQTTSSKNPTEKMLVSHIRMALDGRPFVYSQSAMIVSDSNPVPLFVGRISEGTHQVRLQFQSAPLNRAPTANGNLAWKSVDKIFNIEISAQGGAFQKQTITIVESPEAAAAQDEKTQENKNAPTGPKISEFRKETR
ncbi:hypothetical protein EBR21_02955 [bacterium]|nr:hypothetical protein [bacterium]